VRRQATINFSTSGVPPSITSKIGEERPAEQPSNEFPQIDTQLGERRPVDQSELSPSSPGAQSRGSRRPRPRERMLFASQTRYASPEARFVCDGWCKFSDVEHPNIVSIGFPLQERSDLILVGSSPYPLVQICNARGKARKAR
jgi:hypothetical protein